MRISGPGKTFAMAAMIGALAAAPLAAQSAGSLFDRLTTGLWEIRERGSDRAHRVCLRSERDLVQVRHRGMACRRILIDDSGSSATVQYSCADAGYGRTNMRRETSSLVQLRSDGIERGAPFSLEAEARRVGDCR